MSETVLDPPNVDPVVAARPQTPFQRVVSDFCEDKLAVFGLVLVVLAVFVAIAAPWISPQNPFDIGSLDLLDAKSPPGSVSGDGKLTYWLGTDGQARDMMSAIFYGMRTSLLVGFVSVVAALGIGVVVGLVAAYMGGRIDALLMRIVDIMLSFPAILVALILLSVLGTSNPILIGTIACLASTRVFRLSRAIAGNIVALDYFEAARLRGERLPWLMLHEVLPNALPPLTAEFGLRLCANFLFIAALSFLGLGIQPPLADWGGMVRDNAAAISYGGLAPLIPAAAIGVFAIAINLVVDWSLARQNGQRD